MVNAVSYTDANGKPYRFTEGYRLVILADMATTLPLRHPYTCQRR